MSNNTNTRLTLECNDGHRYIWESPHCYDSIDTILYAFHGLLVTAGWNKETLIDAMKDFMEEHQKIEQTEE